MNDTELMAAIDNFSIEFEKVPMEIDTADAVIRKQITDFEAMLNENNAPDAAYKVLWKNMTYEYRRLATTAVASKIEVAQQKEQLAEKQKMISSLLQIAK